MTDFKTYDKEGWWEECRKAQPELTRDEFEFRWAHFEAVVRMIATMKGYDL